MISTPTCYEALNNFWGKEIKAHQNDDLNNFWHKSVYFCELLWITITGTHWIFNPIKLAVGCYRVSLGGEYFQLVVKRLLDFVEPFFLWYNSLALQSFHVENSTTLQQRQVTISNQRGIILVRSKRFRLSLEQWRLCKRLLQRKQLCCLRISNRYESAPPNEWI